MTLLEESAEEFRKARDENDRREAVLPDLEAANVNTEPLRAEVRETRLRIAEGLSVLAAIEAGCAVEFPHRPGLPGTTP